MKEAKKDDQRLSQVPENDPSKPMDSKKDVEKANDEKINQDFPGYPHYPAKEDIMDQRTDMHRVDVDVENLPNSNNKTGVSQRFPTNESDDSKKKVKGAAASDPDLDDDFSDLNPRTEVDKRSAGLTSLDSANAEIGMPQNVENDDLISDADLSGSDLDDEDTGAAADADAIVTPEERMVLENMGVPSTDNENLHRAALDHTDFDGDELNEEGFGEVLSGTDLDIPEETDETTSEALGQGDEENKYYSLGGDRHENLEEDPSGNL